MTSPRIGFKRMVVGLPQSMANRAAVETALDLAEFLNIELLATFVADPTLPTLAGLSGARELRALDQEWQAIDVAQITRDIDHAITVARQRFAESVKSRTMKTSFDIVAGAEVIASLIRADDIVAIIEPIHPGEKITRHFTRLLDAAFETAAAILAVPSRIVRTTGPIMAVATAPEDPSIRVALEIAAALKERLIVVTQPGTLLSPEILADAEQLGVQVEQIAGSGLVANASARAPFSAGPQERLRVVTRSRLADDAPRLFSTLHGVPLLVVELDRAELAAEQEKRESR